MIEWRPLRTAQPCSDGKIAEAETVLTGSGISVRCVNEQLSFTTPGSRPFTLPVSSLCCADSA